MRKCNKCEKEYDETVKGSIKKYCSKKCGRLDYYENNKDKEKKNCARWYQQNRESEIAKNKEYRELNKELYDWYHNKHRFNGMRDIILLRDGRKCKACESKKKIVIHHKDGSGETSVQKNQGLKTNNDINNLITLCNSCHIKLHHWQKRNKVILDKNEEIIEVLKNILKI